MCGKVEDRAGTVSCECPGVLLWTSPSSAWSDTIPMVIWCTLIEFEAMSVICPTIADKADILFLFVHCLLLDALVDIGRKIERSEGYHASEFDVPSEMLLSLHSEQIPIEKSLLFLRVVEIQVSTMMNTT